MVLQSFKNVLSFLSLRDKKYESRYQVSITNFNQYLNQYKRQKLDQEEQKHLNELGCKIGAGSYFNSNNKIAEIQNFLSKAQK